MADIAGSTSTTATLAAGQSLYSSLEVGGDHDWFRINLVAGRTYEFRLHGVGAGGELSDPTLGIRNAAGTLLAFNDDTNWDAGEEFDSLIRFTATTSGTYYVDAGGYDASETGSYLLTAAHHDPQGMVFTTDEIAWQLTNNFNAFFGSQEAWAFEPGADRALTVRLNNLTAIEQTHARNALRMWSDFTGITFRETTGGAEITFFNDDGTGNAVAFAGPSRTLPDGTILASNVTISTEWMATYGSSLNSYTYQTYVHEIGHALGLGHGGNYNGAANYPSDALYRNDSTAYTVMSYFFPQDNTYLNESFGNAITPGVADMVAMLRLYGDLAVTRAGHTTYGFGSNTGNALLDTAVQRGANMQLCIEDDGGFDVLNFSQTSAAQFITLLADRLSSVLGGRLNLGIGRGTVIEKAIGGSGADRIEGNNAGNVLMGGGGADVLLGLGGNDTLHIQAGDSAYNGGAGTDSAVCLTAGTYNAAGRSIENWVGSAGSDIINAANSVFGLTAGIAMAGGALNDQLFGSGFADRLVGDRGADRLSGGNGADILIGGAEADYLSGGFGNDTLYGGADTRDVFAVRNGSGRDLVADWQDGRDLLDLRGVANVDAFSDLRVGRSGVNAVVFYQADSLNAITVNNAYAAGAAFNALDVLLN